MHDEMSRPASDTTETDERRPGYLYRQAVSTQQPYKFFVGSREVEDTEDPPQTLDAAKRFLCSMLTGADPGTTGHISETVNEQTLAMVAYVHVDADGVANIV